MTNEEAAAKVKAINLDSFVSYDSRHIINGITNSSHRVGIAVRDKEGKFTGSWTVGIGSNYDDAFVDLAHQMESNVNNSK